MYEAELPVHTFLDFKFTSGISQVKKRARPRLKAPSAVSHSCHLRDIPPALAACWREISARGGRSRPSPGSSTFFCFSFSNSLVLVRSEILRDIVFQNIHKVRMTLHVYPIYFGILLLFSPGVHRHRASDQAPALSFQGLCARVLMRERLVELTVCC